MSDPRVWEGACVCGGLKVRLRGDPRFVSSCSCQACQRRTGSFYGVTAFFLDEQIERADPGQTYDRTAESGNLLTQHFCPDCGSTVWWRPHARPGEIGVAAGTFADRSFPPPSRMVWTDERHPWVLTPDDLPTFPRNAR